MKTLQRLIYFSICSVPGWAMALTGHGSQLGYVTITSATVTDINILNTMTVVGTHTVTGALTVNTNLNEAGITSNVLVSGFNSNTTIVSSSNTPVIGGYFTCNAFDTAAPWSGQTGHIPCIVGLAVDLATGTISQIGVEGRTNSKGSGYFNVGTQGHATHYDTGIFSFDTTTIIGLDAVNEMFATTAGTVGESSGGVIGLYVEPPVGQGASGQTFGMIGASTYPYVMAGQLLIEPYNGIHFGSPWLNWPVASQTANLFVNSNGNLLPGEFFESGNLSNYEWMDLGRIGEEADFFVPASANTLMTGTVAGDLGIRATASTSKINLGAGANQAVMIINKSSVTLTGSGWVSTAGQSVFNVVASSVQAYAVALTTTSGGPYILDVSTSGHLNAQTNAAPTVAACGTSPTVNARSSEIHGNVTLGSGSPLACSIVFAQPYNNPPDCFFNVNSSTITVGAYGVSTTSATVSTSAAAGGFKIGYWCSGSD